MNYLLLGPEEYLKSQFIEKLKKRDAGKDKDPAFLCETYYGGEPDLAAAFQSLNTMPFFSKKRIIIIRDAEKIPAKDRKPVLEYLKSPRGANIFILESSSGGQDNKFLGEISGLAELVKCDRLKDRDADIWIGKEFKNLGKEITPELAGLVRELAGTDLFSLKNEIEKIASYLGNTKEVKEPDIETVLGKPTYKRAFEIIDLIAEKRIDRILAGLDNLLIKERPHEILSLLAWQFRNFTKLKKLKRDIPAEEASRALNTSAWLARKIKEKSRKFTLPYLKNASEMILEADHSIKRGTMDPRHALERVLVELSR